ncbi:Wzz/FepE/Etk N-terminal domain-containing protein [Psychromonas sp. MME2]|uniref:Wzz/FepE/Etk N-terminal domain-containing protein n=1 Tax=Psychromonas sp. MME2 TaxID=3231033 RepID=UPI00339C2A87
MNHNYPENMQPFMAAQADDEIDLRELFHALWKGKWIIILCTAVLAVGGVFFALSQPNTYKSDVLLAPTQGSSGGGLSGQLGGLAALAGVNIGGAQADDPKVEALAVLQSRKFIDAFIVKHDLLVPLMASTKWIEDSNTLILDEELYDAATKEWLFDPEENETLKPTLWDANKAFKELLAVSEDKESGMVTISVTHFSPFVAQQWATLLVSELNEWMKQNELDNIQQKSWLFAV